MTEFWDDYVAYGKGGPIEHLNNDESEQVVTPVPSQPVTVPIVNKKPDPLVNADGSVTPISGIDLDKAKPDELDQYKAMIAGAGTLKGNVADGAANLGNQGNAPVAPAVPGVVDAQKKHDPNEKIVYTNEQAVIQARARVEAQYNQYGAVQPDGTTKNVSPDEAKNLAAVYVNNDIVLENIAHTRTTIDKSERDLFNTTKKGYYDGRYDLYRDQGLTKKAARAKAQEDADNEYGFLNLVPPAGRKYIDEHKDYFYVDGKYSHERLAKFASGLRNSHSEPHEADNGVLSLREQYDIEQAFGIPKDAQRAIVRADGGIAENNLTNWYRGAFIAATTAVGAGIGAGTSASAAAAQSASAADAAVQTSAAGAAAAAAAGTGAAAASAVAPWTIAGLAVGYGASEEPHIKGFLRDKGREEVPVYAPGQPKPVVQPDIPPVQPQPDTPLTPVTPVVIQPVAPQPCVEEEIFCDYNYKGGEYWSNIAEGKYLYNERPISGDLILPIAHGLKLKHGVTDFKLNTMPTRKNDQTGKVERVIRLHTDFSDVLTEDNLRLHPELRALQGKVFDVKCDGKVVKGNGRGRGPAYTRFGGFFSDPLRRDCYTGEVIK